MRKLSKFLFVIALCAAGVIAIAAARLHLTSTFPPESDRLLLLVPDGVRFSNPGVTVWLDAANEEGLHLLPIHDSAFLSPLSGRPHCAGLIFPDTIHIRASDVLIAAVRDYVANGGKLMLVYDAGLQSLQGFYANDQSRLSDLAGVKYGLYSALGRGMIRSGAVSGTVAVMDKLGVPPGKYYPISDEGDPAQDPAMEVQLRRYEFGDLEYPSFVTSGNYSGQKLLRTSAGLAAGRGQYGQGEVLFVNLPLGSLEGFTDGLPLHMFLKDFATRMLSLPYLMAVPDGVGGIVLDWHIDSNAAIQPLEQLKTWSLVKQGPFSLDITAGPDTYVIGDKKGFDLPHDSASQGLTRYYEGLGYEIGSHGGWIHNYFGENVNENDAKEMAPFLELNNDAVRSVTGKPVREYSAPVGNQPQWVTRWLEAHGVVAYYFTGDTGMGPTIGYRHGRRAGTTIWAFPILQLDRAATFEEMPKYGYSDAIVSEWLRDATHFVANQRQVRLIYFHPPGILRYERLVDKWMEQTSALKTAGVFRWYTMPEIADFLNARQAVKWTIGEHAETAVLDASAPRTLNHETWRFPKSVYTEPRVVKGEAAIIAGRDSWFVVSGDVKRLTAVAGIVSK